MSQTYEYGYNGSVQYKDYLELEDNMNFALQAFDADFLSYYLIVYTKMGFTSMLEYGPLSQEDDVVPEESHMKYTKFEANEKKVEEAIVKFLGPKKKLASHKKNPFDKTKTNKIVEVNQLSEKEVLDLGINLLDFMRLEMGINKEGD